MKNPFLKRVMVLALPVLCQAAGLLAQTPSVKYIKTFGGKGHDYIEHILPTSEGGFIQAGGLVNDSHKDDYWVIRTDSLGKVVWERTFGGSETDYISSIAQGNDGSILLAGFTRSNDGDVPVVNYKNSADLWLIKLNAGGVVQWHKRYGGSSEESLNSIVYTPDGGYLFAGRAASRDGDVDSTLTDAYHNWTAKLDAGGKIQWQKSYEMTINCITVTLRGEYLLTGQKSRNKQPDGCVIHINAKGEVLNETILDGSGDDYIVKAVTTPIADAYWGGYTRSKDIPNHANHGGTDYWVVKLNKDGDLQWQNLYGGSGDDRMFGMAQTTDEGLLLTGYSQTADGDVSTNMGQYDAWVVKTDKNGKIEWEKSFGGAEVEASTGAAQATNGDYGIAARGYSMDGKPRKGMGADGFLIRMQGPVETPTSIRPSLYGSMTAYPNPVTTELRLSLTNSTGATPYMLNDAAGRTLRTGQLQPGLNTVDMAQLAPGFYILNWGQGETMKLVKQ